MELLKTLNVRNPGTGGAVVLDNWQDNKSAEGIVIDAALPVTVATPGTPATSDLVNLISYFLSTFNLRHGSSQQFAPLEGITGADLRDLSRVLTGREIWNDFVGVAQTAGAKTFRVRFYLPAAPSRMVSALKRKRRIGSVQGRTIKCEVTEGGALTAGALGLTRTAGVDATYDFRVAYKLGGVKQTWCPLPSLRKVDLPVRDLTGPDGLMLLVADANAAASATAIGKHSISIGGNEVVRQAEPRYASADYSRALDAGSSDVTDSMTVLYAADPSGNLDHAPVGACRIALINQDVATMKARFFYIPDIGAGLELADGIKSVAAGMRSAVNATVPDMKGAEVGQQATAPVEFYDPTDSRYHVTDGIVATATGAMRLFISEQSRRAAAAHVNATPGDSKVAAAKQARKLVKLRIPGAVGTDGNGRGGDLGSEGVNRTFAALG